MEVEYGHRLISSCLSGSAPFTPFRPAGRPEAAEFLSWDETPLRVGGPLGLGREFVARAPVSVDVYRVPRIRLEVLPEPQNEVVHGPGGGKGVCRSGRDTPCPRRQGPDR